MKISIMNNTMSSITGSGSAIAETTKPLDDRLKENVTVANYDESCMVNKTGGVDLFFYTQLCEVYEKGQENEEEGL